MDDNPGGDLTIKYSELAAYVLHPHLFAPKMAHLEQIHTLVDNRAAKGWAGRGSISLATDVRPLL